VRLAPALPALAVSCPQCGHAARLKSVEPHAILKMERHTFECPECGLPRSYTLSLMDGTDVGDASKVGAPPD
jgi:predicted RNA-binding Zn-ribbon protein involved in translation (DUF1610 family)